MISKGVNSNIRCFHEVFIAITPLKQFRELQVAERKHVSTRSLLASLN
jgi:hypothetical protein